jgi:hypothetical protein
MQSKDLFSITQNFRIISKIYDNETQILRLLRQLADSLRMTMLLQIYC